MAEPRTVMLRTPIQFGSETIDHLEIRPPKAKDFRRLQLQPGFEIDFLLELTGRLTGHPDAVINELEQEDMEAVLAIVSGFTLGGRKTGSASSVT